MDRGSGENIAAAFCQGNVGKAIHPSSDQNFQEMKAETLSLLKQIDKMDVPEIMQQIKSFSQKENPEWTIILI